MPLLGLESRWSRKTYIRTEFHELGVAEAMQWKKQWWKRRHWGGRKQVVKYGNKIASVPRDWNRLAVKQTGPGTGQGVGGRGQGVEGRR